MGILIEPLHGISEFTGEKGEKGGKLARFIDHYHHLQTIVYLILDNESRSKNIRDRLIKTKSKFKEVKKYVTKPEYIFLWEKNFEFDNFTDDELSNALNQLANQRVLFRASEISKCRNEFGKPRKGDTLSQLYKDKTDYSLPKTQLTESLVNSIIANLNDEFEDQKPKRKILQKITEVIDLASKNHQPITKDTWLKNQEGGFFGTPYAEGASKTQGSA